MVFGPLNQWFLGTSCHQEAHGNTWTARWPIFGWSSGRLGAFPSSTRVSVGRWFAPMTCSGCRAMSGAVWTFRSLFVSLVTVWAPVGWVQLLQHQWGVLGWHRSAGPAQWIWAEGVWRVPRRSDRGQRMGSIGWFEWMNDLNLNIWYVLYCFMFHIICWYIICCNPGAWDSRRPTRIRAWYRSAAPTAPLLSV